MSTRRSAACLQYILVLAFLCGNADITDAAPRRMSAPRRSAAGWSSAALAGSASEVGWRVLHPRELLLRSGRVLAWAAQTV
jgi:hypothetical protein